MKKPDATLATLINPKEADALIKKIQADDTEFTYKAIPAQVDKASWIRILVHRRRRHRTRIPLNHHPKRSKENKMSTSNLNIMQRIGRVETRTSEYEFSHCKRPSGRGSWAFRIGKREELFWFNGLYSEAKAAAVKEARRLNEHTISAQP